jgi:hypothetical protein
MACSPAQSIACGAAPLIELTGSVVIYTDDGKTVAPTQPIRITHSLCAGQPFNTNCGGQYDYQTSQGVPYYLHYQSSEILPSIRGEVDAKGTGPAGRPELFPASRGSGFGFDPTRPLLVAHVLTTLPGQGACSAVDGVTVAVHGHPEIAPTYYDASTPPAAAATATATSASGLVSFRDGLPSSGAVQLDATKAGCRLITFVGNETGNRPLEPGFVSIAPISIAPP